MVEKFDYAEARSDADELIEEFGADAVLRRTTQSGSSFNPTMATAERGCVAVVVDYSERAIDGTLILAGDRMAIIKAGGLSQPPVPSVDQLVLSPGTASEQAFSIIRVKPLNPAGVAVLYEAQVRG